MAEQPVEATDEAATGPAGVATVQQPYSAQLQYFWHRPPPKVVIKADLLPAVSVLSTVSLLGIAVGWLWSRMAPPRQLAVVQGGQLTLVPEGYHRFDDLVLFVLVSLGAGIVTGLAVWFLRERRGPVVMIAAVLGAVVAAWLAMRMGISFAEGRFPVPSATNPGDIVNKAPVIESGWAIVAWPMTTALTYGVMAAWNGMDDLGRRLS